MPLYMKSNKFESLTDEEELSKRGYAVGSTIGEGTYAKVKRAKSEKLNKNIAIKIIDRRRAPGDFQFKFLPRELSVLKKVSHPNIIKVYEILEFNAHGDLLDYISLRGAIGEDKSRLMFQQLVNAVEYLHNINIIHRDLKCENVLLDQKNNVKLADFGFARTVPEGDLVSTFCGSAAYAAPEVLLGKPYLGQAYDVWSLGVILYCMVIGYMPFDDTNIKRMIRHQTEKKIKFPKNVKVSEDCRELIHRMLDPSPKERATVEDIQKSEWLKCDKDDENKETS
ncbi:hypothetical protein LSH36_31g04036 [Paralvinella palmiformis]|uniref:Protein kinase domain-containing protein n=1 Tax=Paralvinella palmiformis TaxID=53620 RepID=A0AAD9KAR0_9ANNE|nr:hypothetical protein LSH36_31g04036 [Paralvinella palmiformis]